MQCYESVYPIDIVHENEIYTECLHIKMLMALFRHLCVCVITHENMCVYELLCSNVE